MVQKMKYKKYYSEVLSALRKHGFDINDMNSNEIKIVKDEIYEYFDERIDPHLAAKNIAMFLKIFKN